MANDELDPTTDVEEAPKPGSTALQSLLVDEGAGAPLAAAAGDVASRKRGYSARTQAATVVAYHVMGHSGVERQALVEELLVLDNPSEPVYTDPSAEFAGWLASAHSGDPAASAIPSGEPATRVVPLGVWFRHDAEGLVRAVIDTVRIENFDAATVVTAAAVAGAVAGSSLVMSGYDLLLAAGETGQLMADVLDGEGYRYSRVAESATIVAALKGARPLLGRPAGEAIEAFRSQGVAPELAPILAAISVAAHTSGDPVLSIEDAAINAGADAGVVAGALVGARVGLRRWPWSVPNETWFAEIGRRLVAHITELRDLPIPYAVEHRMKSGGRVDPRDELG